MGINKRSEIGLRTGAKDFKTGFYKGRDRAKTGQMVKDRPTQPFVDALILGNIYDIDTHLCTSDRRLLTFE